MLTLFRGTLFAVFLCCSLPAQNATLSGLTMDESHAFVPGARVSLSKVLSGGASATPLETSSDGAGRYSFSNLAPGVYLIQAASSQLATGAQSITLKAGAQTLDLQLHVNTLVQHLEVGDPAAPTVSLESSANAGALVIKGEDLDALSDNPDDLQADLQALAGPSAGPSGGSLFVDGFSGGEIPPKQSIREIRINQDPFSAEYDKLGYGRIEIFTKPGSEKFHGELDYNLGDSIWNSRNPYASKKAPLLLNEFEGGFGGPLSKRASFTLDYQRNLVDNGSITNAVVVEPQTFVISPFNSIFTTPQRYLRLTPRVDYQVSSNNTLSVRYGFTHGDINGAGIGAFDLATRGYHTRFTNQTAQVTDTAVIGGAVNETRFQYYRAAIGYTPRSLDPEIQVLGSFNSGGTQLGNSADTQSMFEFQNYTSVVKGTHMWRFGVRARGYLDDSVAPVDFNGTYTFTSAESYRLTLLYRSLGYSAQQIRAQGGGASQFTIASGVPSTSVNQFDAGIFAGDTWRWRPNLSISYGLRYEIQTNMQDPRDLAPRVSVAWSPASASHRKTVLRAGFGTFYDRFALTNTLAAERYNGVVQQQFVITNPDTFPAIPPIALLDQNRTAQSIEKIDPHIRAPYILQTAVSFERQLLNSTTLAITYTNAHGVHLLRSRDINAPSNGIYPYGSADPITLIESTGVYNQNQLIANITTKLNKGISLFGFYVFNRALSSSDGVNTSPANPYNYSGEYGAAATDIRHRVTAGGSVNLRWNIRLSPFFIAQTGAPFNITTGNDFYGTAVFNARPGIATDPSKPGLIPTSYGLLDPNPSPGEVILARNAGRGPMQVTANLRIAKTVGFGGERRRADSSPPPSLAGPQRQGGGQGNGPGLRSVIGAPTVNRRYNLIFSLSARNILNHNNPGPIIGNITSPLFGQANQLAGGPNGEGFSENASNRRLEMQVRLSF